MTLSVTPNDLAHQTCLIFWIWGTLVNPLELPYRGAYYGASIDDNSTFLDDCVPDFEHCDGSALPVRNTANRRDFQWPPSPQSFSVDSARIGPISCRPV